jgi:hypothetical protein
MPSRPTSSPAENPLILLILIVTVIIVTEVYETEFFELWLSL